MSEFDRRSPGSMSNTEGQKRCRLEDLDVRGEAQVLCTRDSRDMRRQRHSAYQVNVYFIQLPESKSRSCKTQALEGQIPHCT